MQKARTGAPLEGSAGFAARHCLVHTPGGLDDLGLPHLCQASIRLDLIYRHHKLPPCFSYDRPGCYSLSRLFSNAEVQSKS